MKMCFCLYVRRDEAVEIKYAREVMRFEGHGQRRVTFDFIVKNTEHRALSKIGLIYPRSLYVRPGLRGNGKLVFDETKFRDDTKEYPDKNWLAKRDWLDKHSLHIEQDVNDSKANLCDLNSSSKIASRTFHVSVNNELHIGGANLNQASLQAMHNASLSAFDLMFDKQPIVPGELRWFRFSLDIPPEDPAGQKLKDGFRRFTINIRSPKSVRERIYPRLWTGLGKQSEDNARKARSIMIEIGLGDNIKLPPTYKILLVLYKPRNAWYRVMDWKINDHFEEAKPRDAGKPLDPYIYAIESSDDSWHIHIEVDEKWSRMLPFRFVLRNIDFIKALAPGINRFKLASQIFDFIKNVLFSYFRGAL